MLGKVFLFFFLCTSFFVKGHALFGNEVTTVYQYGGIPGCECFQHCNCFTYALDGVFPKHQYFPPQDLLWHDFLRKYTSSLHKGPYFPWSENYIRQLVTVPNSHRYVSLVSEYLNSVERLLKVHDRHRQEYIEWCVKQYSRPIDAEKLSKAIDTMNQKYQTAADILSTILSDVIPRYKEIIEECSHREPYNLALIYNKGLISLMEGNAEASLKDIGALIELAKISGQDHLLNSEVFQKQGEMFLEVGLYHQAIESLNKAIVKDPKNFEAYFQRASAYFEIGDFEHSLDDYIASKKSDYFVPYKLPPNEFVDAFSEFAFKGAKDAVCDFLPSLCHTTYGLGECLWAFGEHPIDSMRNLAGAGYEMVEHIIDYMKTVDKDTMHEYVGELVLLYENFSNLTDREIGELIGYSVGKYGVEILAGSTALKGVSAYKQLKDANRICNLESMLMTTSSKEAVISKGLQQYAERCNFFENTKIHWGQQDKHIPGTNNYISNKSIFEHQDASGLLKKNAGTGTPKRGEMGKPGYQELIDFKERIGFWVSEDGLQLPTTKGAIHYSNKGAHIVPMNPERKIW